MRIRSQYFKKEYDLNKAELIGQGNFAQVFRAYDSDLGDSIAIRRVKKSQGDLDDINKQKQINDELRKVDNQNILKIFDIIDQPQAVWYITEYCSGGSLWDALNLCKDNKMSEKQGLECVLQISKGVQELHNHRITHRDLKPQNILLKTKYVPGKALPLIKLADFGLSTQKIIMETIAGTKQYIAPEQAKFHNYTNAVDVWSLGIIFDEILHGTPFYSGEDNKQVFSKILKMPFKIRDQNLRVSVKELLVSLLKKKPYQRPIIAVIRSTIQKILQQIDAEIQLKQQQNPIEKNKKSKSSNNNNNQSVNESIRSTTNEGANGHSVNSPKQNILGIHSRRVYELNTKEKEKQAIKQKEEVKIQKGYFKKQITPNNKSRPNIQKPEDDMSKNLSTIASKNETKDSQKLVTINEIREKVQKIEKQKSTPQLLKQQIKQQKQFKQTIQTTIKSAEKAVASSKIESNVKPVQHPVSSALTSINDKITIYKIDRRKMIASNVKRQQLKPEIVDISYYMQKVFGSKKQILDRHIKLEKQHSFLPNTYLSASQFLQKCQKTDEPLRVFKKKHDYLNYFSSNQDYQIKILNGQAELKNNRKICEDQIIIVKETIRDIFFAQMDNFIDQFVEKVIK